MATTWDSDFEKTPPDTVEDAKDGPSRIQELKTAISEREDKEHNFKLGTKPFHKPGLCSVMHKGTTASIDALTTASEGCMAYDTDLEKLKAFVEGEGWVIVSNRHSGLAGLDVDDHPQYLQLTKTGQTLMQNLEVEDGKTIDGRDLSVDGLVIDAMPITRGFGAWVLLDDTAFSVVHGPEPKDCFISAYGLMTSGDTTSNAKYIKGSIGLTSSPSIVISQMGNLTGYIPYLVSITGWRYLDVAIAATHYAITFPVPKGYYWKVTANGPTFQYIRRLQLD